MKNPSTKPSLTTLTKLLRVADRNHLAILHSELGIAPSDAVRSEAGKPDHKMHSITNRNEVPAPPDRVILQNGDSDHPRHSQPKHEIGSNRSRGYDFCRSENGSGDSPGKPMCENKSEIGDRAAETNRARPA